MQSKIWKKSILIMVPLFLALSFVNIVMAADFNSDKDRVITSIVVDKLQSDSELKGSGIDVETKNGEVTLKGMVNSQADINRAAELAYGVEGVKKIDNRLQTLSSHHYPRKPGMTDCQIGANWC